MSFRKVVVGILVFVLPIFLAACGVMTEKHLYDEKGIVADPAIEAKWKGLINVKEGEENKSVMNITFDKDKKQYTIKDGMGQGKDVKFTLFRLGPHIFAEFPRPVSPTMQYFLSNKIAFIEGRAMLYILDNIATGELAKVSVKSTLQKNDELTNSGDGVTSFAITDTPENSKAFILKYTSSIFPQVVPYALRDGDDLGAALKTVQSKEQQSFDVLWFTYTLARMGAVKGVDDKQFLEFKLAEEACDPKIAAIYNETRAIFVALDKAHWRPVPLVDDKKAMQQNVRAKLEAAEMATRMKAASPDVFNYLASVLPADNPTKPVVEKLAKRFNEAVAEIEKKHGIKFYAE